MVSNVYVWAADEKFEEIESLESENFNWGVGQQFVLLNEIGVQFLSSSCCS